MPLYEYQCKKCNAVFEAMQKFSDEPLKKHEGCGGKVDRLISAPAFHLKGSGWYVTDYGKGGSTPAASSESKAEAKSEAKSEATETKSETKSKSESKPKSEPKAAAS